MGFDPRGSAFYHALLKREARLAQRRGFAGLTVGALTQQSAYVQRCTLQLDPCDKVAAPPSSAPANGQQQPAAEQHQHYFFFDIADLIAIFFRQNCWQSWRHFALLVLRLVVQGLIWRTRRVSPLFSLFLCYPLLLVLLSTLASFGLLAALVNLVVAKPPDWPVLLFLTPVTFYGSYLLLRFTERWHYCLYLLGDFLFTIQISDASNLLLEQRLQLFATELAVAVQQARPDEEILLVGHSSGGMLAIRLAALVLQQLPADQHYKLALLTMGNQTSAALANRALPLRQAVLQLSSTADFCWREVFAPQDVISSGKFDLIHHLTGQPAANFAFWSARIRESMAGPSYRAMQLHFFKLHMQYLRASETGAGFDYLQLLSQNQPLAHYQPAAARHATTY